jgi:hypothetical protein
VTAAPVAWSRVRAQVDLPAGVAAWVLVAHALTLASPFVLLWATHAHADHLARMLDRPVLVDVAAGAFLVGSAFEAAQNTADRWYYEGPYPALADLLFNGAIALGLGALALAASGHEPWIIAAVVVCLAAFPVLYLSDRAPFPVTGILGVLAVALLWHRLHSPLVWLMLVFSPGLNLTFLGLIVRTRAQSLHGAIALSNGVGLLAVVVAIDLSASGRSVGWVPTVAIALTVGLLVLVAWGPLSRLGPTVRPSGLLPAASPGERFAATLQSAGPAPR